MHLDLLANDLAATEARVLAAGATRFDFQPSADHCLVFADPPGYPFCLTTWDDLGPEPALEPRQLGGCHRPRAFEASTLPLTSGPRHNRRQR
jgi:hypothetical protein